MLIPLRLVQSCHWKGDTVPPEYNIRDSLGSQSLYRSRSPLENSLESVSGPQQVSGPHGPHNLPPPALAPNNIQN